MGTRQLPLLTDLPKQCAPTWQPPAIVAVTVDDVIAIISRVPPLTREQARKIERATRYRQRSTPGVQAVWTKAEEVELIRLVLSGMTDTRIADALDRSAWSVRSRVRLLRKQGRLIDDRRKRR